MTARLWPAHALILAPGCRIPLAVQDVSPVNDQAALQLRVIHTKSRPEKSYASMRADDRVASMIVSSG